MNPTFTREQAQAFLDQHGITDKVVLLGYRSATSKYGEYDDTIALVCPTDYTEFKANTLPSKWEPGIARLMPGVYEYRKGLHGVHHFADLSPAQHTEVASWLNANPGKDHAPIAGKILPYWAFRQAGSVNILRDGQASNEQDGWPGNPAWIDIHCGGWNGTSSAGCQTVFPDAWPALRPLGYGAMDQWGITTIRYCLIQL